MVVTSIGVLPLMLVQRADSTLFCIHSASAQGTSLSVLPTIPPSGGDRIYEHAPWISAIDGENLGGGTSAHQREDGFILLNLKARRVESDLSTLPNRLTQLTSGLD